MRTCQGCGQSFAVPRKKPWQTYCRLACMTAHGPWIYPANKPQRRNVDTQTATLLPKT